MWTHGDHDLTHRDEAQGSVKRRRIQAGVDIQDGDAGHTGLGFASVVNSSSNPEANPIGPSGKMTEVSDARLGLIGPGFFGGPAAASHRNASS